MRRATAALIGTVAGTALLVGAKYAAPVPVGAGSAVGTDTGADPGDQGVDVSVSGSVDPAGGAPVSPGAVPSAGPTSTKASPGRTTTAPTATKTTTPASCKTAAGAGATIANPGVGVVVVTVKVCNGVLTSASATLSESNWKPNAAAFVELNSKAVQYYKTNLAAITVGGATRTSEAYVKSLKSAMTAAA